MSVIFPRKYISSFVFVIIMLTNGCSIFSSGLNDVQNSNFPKSASVQPTQTLEIQPSASIQPSQTLEIQSSASVQPTPTSEILPLAVQSVPTSPVEPSAPPPDFGIVYWENFETGDISEVNAHGGFVRQGTSGSYNIVTPFAHTGRFSVALKINTDAPSDTGSHSAYLFFWDAELIPEDSYYYSAWYFIPSDVKPSDWWNIWQWLSNSQDPAGQEAMPIFDLDISQQDGETEFRLFQWPSLSDDQKVINQQNVAKIPFDKWFQIEGFYKKAQDMSGQVVVWLDGVEVFNVAGVQTALSYNNVVWSVNNYAAEIQPNPCIIYIDDIVISKKRIGTDPLTLP